jgi:hypothetical protein
MTLKMSNKVQTSSANRPEQSESGYVFRYGRLHFFFQRKAMKSIHMLMITMALSACALNTEAANLLVVLSDSDHLDLKGGKVFPTGFYLNELMQPVKLLIDAGHQVTFTTPNGTAPTLDTSSVNAMYFSGDEAALHAHKALLDQLKMGYLMVLLC